MRNDLSNAFAGVIAQAARTSADTGQTEKYARRLAVSDGPFVMLLDCSASMGDLAHGQRKIDLLRYALRAALVQAEEPRLIAFATAPTPLDSLAGLPSPSGSTALHLALGAAATHRPRHTLVVSDGRPDDEGRALAMADQLPGVIDVLYIGPEDDAQAIAFMNRLARTGAGRVVVHDVAKPIQPLRLGDTIRGLLPASGGTSHV